MNSPVLEYCVSARYGSREVLHRAAGAIGAGEIVSLVGLSGSGKSTLALALLRLLEYRGGTVEGSIRLEGREILPLGGAEMRGILGRRIGYVPQSPAAALNARLRVRTLIEETWRAHCPERMPAERRRSLLESVHLPASDDFLGQRAGELSTGQGQRLLIALAILHNPAIVIADEPTSALDAITQAAILRLFAELNRLRGMAMLFISHDLPAVAAMSDRVEILHEGRVVESGTPDSIFHAPRHPFTKELVDAIPKERF